MKINDNTRNELARHGLEILKRAVLDVLYQEAKEGGIVDRETIFKKLPILCTEKEDRNTYSLIVGVLSHLADDGHARYVPYEKGGQITEEGISVIEN